MKTIGVLALQGAFKEHINHIEQLGHKGIEVRTLEDLNRVDGLILPGGESTAMAKLLDDFNLKVPLADRIRNGLPTWGTCAGMILLAKNLEDTDTGHLQVMSITVKRNAYGRQLDSFVTTLPVSGVAEDGFPLVFIRAPLVTKTENHVEILAKVGDEIVAVKENHLLATSFHPELTNCTDFHQYFINMIDTSQKA